MAQDINTPALKERIVTDTGAVREKEYPQTGQFTCRTDLILNNHVGFRRLGDTYGEGAAKYGPNNWKKGFKESVLLSHALEHMRLHMANDKSEDHLAHAVWNLYTLMWMQEMRPELIDVTNDSRE